MNIHHLELFYYVAKHRGIVAACRHIPYGIQQPAVSSQIATLEVDLKVRLFNRRPFQLTPSGEQLWNGIAPFFSQLAGLEAEMRGEKSQELRLAGPTQVLRDHLPEVIAELQRSYPKLRLSLHDAGQRESEELILRGEIDVAVGVLEERLAAGLRAEVLIKLPLVLLVPKADAGRSVSALLREGAKGERPLISLPPHERLSRLFREYLRKKELVWPVGMEVSSNELIGLYVARGLGVGLSAHTPGLKLDPTVVELPIKDAPKLPIGIFWRGKLAPIAQAFVERLKLKASWLSSAA